MGLAPKGESPRPLARTTVRALLSGRTRRVQPGTDAVLLAVDPAMTGRTLVRRRTASSRGGVLLDATGTRRRVQALSAGGWTPPRPWLAGSPNTVSSHRPATCAASPWPAGCRCGGGPRSPPSTTRGSVRPGSDPRAAARARTRGWLVAWWWEEDTIDRPDHDPIAAAATAACRTASRAPTTSASRSAAVRHDQRAHRPLLERPEDRRPVRGVRAHRGPPARRGAHASELAESDVPARQHLADSFARWQGHLRDGLTRMRERGELRADADPDRLALALLAVVQGGLLLDQTYRDTAPLEAALDAMIAYIRGFAATERR